MPPPSLQVTSAVLRLLLALKQQQEEHLGHDASPLLTESQQRGLVALACDRKSHVAAAVAEAMRLRSFRQAPRQLRDASMWAS